MTQAGTPPDGGQGQGQGSQPADDGGGAQGGGQAGQGQGGHQPAQGGAQGGGQAQGQGQGAGGAQGGADGQREPTPTQQLRAAHDAAVTRAQGLERQLTELQASTAATIEGLRRRVLHAEVAALAAGQISDPQDAVRLLDLSDLSVAADGAIETAKIRERIAALVESKPYLRPNGYAPPRELPGGGVRPGAGGQNLNTLIRRAAGRGN